MSHIKNHRDHGVYIEFENGNNISTIWGIGSYSSNRSYKGRVDSHAIPDDQPADTVEVRFNCGNKLHKRLHKKFAETSDDSVIGWLTIEQWLYIVNALQKEAPRKE